jgi:hypothetical protein
MRTWPRELADAGDDDPGAEGAVPTEVRPSEPIHRSTIGRIADVTFLLGTFLAPLYGKRFGGLTGGVTYADVALALAIMVRLVDLVISGIRWEIMRRHSFLLGMTGLFGVIGLVTGFLAGRNPIEWEFIRIVIFTWMTVALVATYGTQDRKAMRQILMVYVFGTTVLALSSFRGYQIAGRPLGWSIHPNALGHSVMMGTFAAVWLWDNAKRTPEKWLWAGAAGLNVLALMRSGSRGGFLGIALGGLVYLVRRGDRRLTLAAVLGACALVVIFGSGAITLPANNPIARLVNQGESNSSGALADQARHAQLDSDLARINAHPLLGDGFKDIALVHVAYLQGWVGAGAFAGLVMMMVGLAMFLLPFVTRRRDMALACGAVAVATAWAMTNIFTLRDQWIFLAIAFSSAQSISVLGSEYHERRRELT